MKNKNGGFSLLSLIIGMALAGFVLIYGFDIGKGYLDQQTIRTAVNAALGDAKINSDFSSASIKARIMKSINVNYINLGSDSVSVAVEGTKVNVDVEFSKTIQINKTIRLVMDLDVSESASIN